MMVSSIQAAEAAGYGLSDIARENGHVVNGTPVPTYQDEQQYINQIRNWTRIRFFATAALGFVGPALPSNDFDTKALDARLQDLLNELPYNDAINEYLSEHPDATPWTVSKSTTTGEDILPRHKPRASSSTPIASSCTRIPMRPAGSHAPRATSLSTRPCTGSRSSTASAVTRLRNSSSRTWR
jgi:hypothetical protein